MGWTSINRSLIPGGGRSFISTPQGPLCLWSPPNLQFNGYREHFVRGWSGRGVQMTAVLYIELILRNSGAIPSFSHMFSRRAQGKIHFLRLRLDEMTAWSEQWSSCGWRNEKANYSSCTRWASWQTCRNAFRRGIVRKKQACVIIVSCVTALTRTYATGY